MAETLEFEIGTGKLLKLFKKALRTCTTRRLAKPWRRFMTQEAAQLKVKIVERVAGEGPIGVTRAYRTRIRSWVRGSLMNLTGTVAHDGVPYAIVIEKGRDPDRPPPPVDELVPWVAGVMRPTDDQDEAVEPEDIRSIAFAVSKSIGQRGIFQPGQESLRGQSGPGYRQFARTLAAQTPGIQHRGADFLLQTITGCIDDAGK